MTTVEIVGVYLVEAPEPCHLVELVLRENGGSVDVGQFTQPVANRPADEWQVPYGEKLLDPDGVTVTWNFWDGPGDHELWTGDVRLAFFFHFLDPSAPLRTSSGDVALPVPSPRPERLQMLA